jgi:hypothetical protein
MSHIVAWQDAQIRDIIFHRRPGWICFYYGDYQDPLQDASFFLYFSLQTSCGSMCVTYLIGQFPEDSLARISHLQAPMGLLRRMTLCLMCYYGRLNACVVPLPIWHKAGVVECHNILLLLQLAA